jgi:hypothetical protein
VAKKGEPGENGCFTGIPVYWKNRCVGFSVQRAASRLVPFDEATRIVSTAFAQWSQASCAAESGPSRVSIDVRDIGEVSCDTIGYSSTGENQNVILFRDDKWPHVNKDETLGLTTVTFNTTSGEILDADIEINTFDQIVSITDQVAAEGYDLSSIVQHEGGHFLGLAHSFDEEATMNAFYSKGESKKRYLKQDDILGLCSAYQPDGTRVTAGAPLMADGTCNPLPRRGIARDCADSGGVCGLGPSGALSAPWMLLACTLFLRRRRHSETV